MGVGAGLYMYVVVVQKFTFAISSPDEFLFVVLSSVLRVMKGLTTGVRASLRHLCATTTATGNLRNTRFPIDQSQSVSHVVSQNTLSHFRISQITHGPQK